MSSYRSADLTAVRSARGQPGFHGPALDRKVRWGAAPGAASGRVQLIAAWALVKIVELKIACTGALGFRFYGGLQSPQLTSDRAT